MFKLPIAVSMLAVLTSCSAGSPGPAATVSSSPAPVPCSNAARNLHIATAIAGDLDPASATFVADQSGLFDPRQFSDVQFYSPGYHWKIDLAFSPLDVVALRQLPPQGTAPAVELTLNAAGAARVRADTTTAFNAPKEPPANQIAMFSGSEVVEAPEVLAIIDASAIQLYIPSTLADGRTAAQVVHDIC